MVHTGPTGSAEDCVWLGCFIRKASSWVLAAGAAAATAAAVRVLGGCSRYHKQRCRSCGRKSCCQRSPVSVMLCCAVLCCAVLLYAVAAGVCCWRGSGVGSTHLHRLCCGTAAPGALQCNCRSLHDMLIAGMMQQPTTITGITNA
jgi:hypothetical protein